jgi:arylformamidase
VKANAPGLGEPEAEAGLARRRRMTQLLRVKVFDISVPVRNGGPVYPGNPAIRIEPHSQLSKGASSNLSTIAIGSHTGTHVDAQHHFVDGGAKVDEMPLEVLIGPARLIAFAHDVMSVTAAALRQHNLEGVRRLLIHTRNSSFVNDPAFHPDFTFVAPDAAEYLVAIGVQLVGVDYYSIEQFRSGHHRTHRTLLTRGVIIVEGLDFSRVPAGDYTLCCLPLLLTGLDGAPARAVLTTN